MAKNTFSSAFRKIDVDQYNEDNFKEDDTDLGGPVGPDENEITGLLNQGKNIDALKAVLQSAPLGSKNQQVKVRGCISATPKQFLLKYFPLLGQCPQSDAASTTVNQINANGSGGGSAERT